MDKKKKMKLILAACFVVFCGVGYLGIRVRSREQILLEKASEETMAFTEAGDGIAKLPEKNEAETTEGSQTAQEASTLMTDTPDKQVHVHVCGAVAKEGVYALSEGSRVADGIAAAGGFSEEADTTYHNLAARLFDGQKIYVPTRTETEELSVPERTGAADAGGTDKEVSGEKVSKKVNLNTAGVEELMTLSGIGEAKAKSIIQYREKVGPFQSIEEIKNVSGIGDAMFERVRESIIAE